ncbi:MAG: metallophosphoesterase [Verrucomicrobiales bacterium]|nr:metallophosphoesterase [Verrucomicrobiales bacterium]
MPRSLPNTGRNASCNAEVPAGTLGGLDAEVGLARIAEGTVLDHRLALVHPEGGWLAIADLHYGFESHRRKQGALLPAWGMQTTRQAVLDLLAAHRPRTLILVGDVMDGSGAADATAALLKELRQEVPLLIPLLGNHDRPALTRDEGFQSLHVEGRFLFHHGHEPMQVRAWLDQQARVPPGGWIHVCGHLHPGWRWRDGAGLSLRAPALLRERLTAADDPLTHAASAERWVLPAFSPWAAGGVLKSPHTRLGTWACLGGRVFAVPDGDA